MQISTIAALFHGAGQPFEICEWQVSPPHPEDLLVQVSLANICGSDLHTVAGRRSAPTPCVLGHEAVGRIAAPTEIYDACGQPLREGDRVTWSIMAACGECQYCTTRNLPQKCDRLFKYGHARSEAPYLLNGGFATHIHLRRGTAIYRIPNSISDIEATPLNCALATVLAGLNSIPISKGACAVVQGAGMLGIYAACCLREHGYEIVAVVDGLAERLRIVKDFGATHPFNLSESSPERIEAALLDLTHGHGADLAVEASGSVGALTNSLDWLGIGGHCLTLGFVFPNAHVTIDAQKIVTKCVTIHGVHNYHPALLGTALQFIESTRKRYPIGKLIGAIYPLKGIDTAFDRAMRGDLIRVAIAPGER